MALIATLASALGLAALGARAVSAYCISYGMDFQNGGKYFQNSNSNDDFTFVSEFEGCQNDTAYNILVDSVGDQTLCSDTNLTPDNVAMLSTCPIEKGQLSSGNWSVVIISNNGDSGAPIAYQRDFVLSVGPQLTSTYTPTATATLVSTPVVNTTVTITTTFVKTLPPSSVTSPSVTVTPTTAVTLARVTETTTMTPLTLKFTAYKVAISPEIKTKTASCKLPTKTARDIKAMISPTVGPAAKIMSSKFRREVYEAEKKSFVEERAERLALFERAPDPQPLVITDTNIADWTTVTATSTAPAVTATLTTEVTKTTTSTPPAVAVLSGKTTASAVTVTAAAPTKTVTTYTIATSITTKTTNYVYSIITTTTPSAAKAPCTYQGGTMY